MSRQWKRHEASWVGERRGGSSFPAGGKCGHLTVHNYNCQEKDVPSTLHLRKERGRARFLLEQGRDLCCQPSKRKASPDPLKSTCLGHCLNHRDDNTKLLNLDVYGIHIHTHTQTYLQTPIGIEVLLCSLQYKYREYHEPAPRCKSLKPQAMINIKRLLPRLLKVCS